jgi:arginine-tRNA-protein transferase
MKPLVHERTDATQRFSHWPALPPPRRIPLTTLGPHPCPYLPGRTATDRAFLATNLGEDLYHELMDSGFRRSGRIVYQPACRGCRACRPIRLRASEVVESKSLRRCRRRNADLRVEVTDLQPTPEKFELYCRYQTRRHGETQHLDWPSFVDFLYDTPTRTIEFSYRDDAGQLVAVGICDAAPQALSSVYFYYDPDQMRRGVGTFGILAELDHCRRHRLPFYYLGFWVEGCPAMEYKASFRPAEVLGTDGVWRDYLIEVDKP